MMDTYASSYAIEFNPIPHEDYWSYPDFPILHLDYQMIRDKGSLRSSRIRNEVDLKEPSVKIRCGLCKIEGYNCRNCPKNGGGQSSNRLPQGNLSMKFIHFLNYILTLMHLIFPY